MPDAVLDGRFAGGSARLILRFDGPLPMAPGMHIFEVCYKDRVLTRVPLTINVRSTAEAQNPPDATTDG
jgi:hypothetical protein